MDGLQEFALMVADSGMVNLLDELGIFVDEPRLPQYIGSCVFYLQNTHSMKNKNVCCLNILVESLMNE